MKYIFLAEADTAPDLLTKYLMDFLGRMLKIDAAAADPEILDIILSDLEVFIDVNKDRVILVYEY